MKFDETSVKVELGGLEFDNPLLSLPLPRREYREFKEGTRTTIREIWIDRFISQGKETFIERQCLQMSNRGACTLDGKQLKDKDDIDRAKFIFANIKVADR